MADDGFYNFGVNPCIACDERVCITNYDIEKDATMTFKSLILLKEYIPSVCSRCNFFVCNRCRDSLDSKCVCDGNVIPYREFCAIMSEKDDKPKLLEGK